MHRLIIIMITLAVSFTPTRSVWAAEILAGIKGADDRLIMPSDEYPWSAVGRINTETGGHCTGVIVGPALVVTAAHCLYDKRMMWHIKPQQVHFVAGFRNGEFTAHTVAKKYFIPMQYDELADPSKQNALHDWAIIQLSEAIGFQTGWIGVRHTGLDEAFVQAGYSRDSKAVLSAHVGCPIISRDDVVIENDKMRALLVHRCDAVPGDSGSPIFYYHDDKPYLAAIHVATTKKQRPVRGVAVPVSTFVRGIKQLGGGEPAYPEGEDPRIIKTMQLLLDKLEYPSIDAFFTDQGLETLDPLGYHTIGQIISVMKPNP